MLSALSALASYGEPMLPRVVSRPGEAPPRRYRHRPGSRLYAPNGKQEVARRLRQIQNGQLRVTA